MTVDLYNNLVERLVDDGNSALADTICDLGLHGVVSSFTDTRLAYLDTKTNDVLLGCHEDASRQFILRNLDEVQSVCPAPGSLVHSCLAELFESCEYDVNLFARGYEHGADTISVGWGPLVDCPPTTLSMEECDGLKSECEEQYEGVCLYRKCLAQYELGGFLYTCSASSDLYRRPCFGAADVESCVQTCFGDGCGEKCALECGLIKYNIGGFVRKS
jgi:hypothetical protein